MRTLATLSCLLLFIFAGSGPVLAAEASPSPAPSAAATPLAVNPICSQAFAAAETLLSPGTVDGENGAPGAAPARLDVAIRSCASLPDWAAAARLYPDALHGAEAMALLMERCADPTADLDGYATCQSLAVALEPGLLAVVTRGGDLGSVVVGPDIGVEIILDTSGSMRKKLDGRPRIDIAREALVALVSEDLPEGVPVALRTFGGAGKGKKARCDTRLTLSLAPLDVATTVKLIGTLKAAKTTKTPLAAALIAVADDLATVTGQRTIVLITDGAETCKGDPKAAIGALRASGLDVHVNIVGFALEDESLKEKMAAWAELGGGSYFDVAGAEALIESVVAAVKSPYRVYGPSGEVIAGGTVDGDPVALDPGTYRVEVLTEPLIQFNDVMVPPGAAVELEIPGEEDED
jgi:hypothetical protein